MLKRKRSEDEHENLERWLVSYADFITLLFAFFVVMYSISSVNEGKYRVLSQSLAAVFTASGQVVRTTDPIQVGEPMKGRNIIGQPDAGLHADSPIALPESQAEDRAAEMARLDGVATRIEAVLAPYVQDDLVVVKRKELWVEIEMKSGLFFPSGSAKLSDASLPMLYRMSEIFREISNPIHVEGHTDDKPISTPEFPSNWALSSARAAVVVNQLMRDGIDPRRLAAIGYGEHHPIAVNATEEGRYQNRRVVILLISNGAARYPVAAEAAAAGAQSSSEVGKP